ncbi:tryptophan synthase subunit alpha [Desulfonema ishimotonii]|uniref:Tryptophan synthase alpha chain n=1 Tax=Desulfonema ishimotonii TaxID=45657 RepID=A0A401FU78_9BACT|nr:tryptophan synthase subunit alpha [Desulfonema ishimotonii]GBC60532.1 tryptophan synthase subunit alpha [Desulfonema ishimotonii]
MNRIHKTFETLKQKNEKALVGFVSAGDPDVETSLKIVEAMCEAGLDVLELGIPFSDPTSDGPVIQRSSARALEKGVNPGVVLEMTKKIREKTDIPIILFSYYNPILAYGNDAFYRDAVAAGADGVLVVDLPPEESDEMTAQWAGNGLDVIRLIAPTTPVERMAHIADGATGFLYLVSMIGITGSGGLDTAFIRKYADDLRSVTGLPICVGFGISTAEHVRAVASVADGVVIGSAFERMIEENIENPDLAGMIGERVREYKAATR